MLANLLGGPDVLIVAAVIALLFGASRLPKLARSLGSAKTEFEKGVASGHQAGQPAPAATTPATTTAPAPPPPASPPIA